MNGMDSKQQKHLLGLLKRNSASNRKLAHEADLRGDSNQHWFHLGQALAYRRVAQRLEKMEFPKFSAARVIEDRVKKEDR